MVGKAGSSLFSRQRTLPSRFNCPQTRRFTCAPALSYCWHAMLPHESEDAVPCKMISLRVLGLAESYLLFIEIIYVKFQK